MGLRPRAGLEGIAMELFTQLFGDLLAFVYHCFDRIVIYGYLSGLPDTQATRLNPQQHVKTAELLLAHRHHRHGAPPGTPEPGDVSPLSCRGVSSLYCAYIVNVA